MVGIVNIYGRRDELLPDVFQYDDMPKKLRTQIYFILDRTILKYTDVDNWEQDYVNEPLSKIHDIICEERGELLLHDDFENTAQGIVAAFKESDDTQLVLQIIETVFRFMRCMDDWKMVIKPTEAIKQLNYRFRENGVGYEFDLTANKLIRLDNTVTHQQALRPALYLLADPDYETANVEFCEALDDYKRQDFDDCLTKCCSAFESVVKIICDKKGWSYSQTDSASKLIDTIIKHTNLDGFFSQPLFLIATMRNRLSRSHGRGVQQIDPPDYIARFALNATASSILLVHQAAFSK